MSFSANVTMADGTTYVVKKLLSKGETNAKLAKSNKKSDTYYTVGLSLSPANESGYEVCASRSPGCTKACLFTAGHGAYANVKNARIAKTRFFFQDRAAFMTQLRSELRAFRKKASKLGKKLAVRLNVVSDLPWEKLFPELFSEFSDVQFYDYTKHVKRIAAFELSRECNDSTFFPLNYHLTFSRSETNFVDCNKIYSYKYANVAVVFDSKELPSHYAGREVVNGDETDLRFLDKPGVIIGLYAKGQGRKDTSGFIVQTIGLIQR